MVPLNYNYISTCMDTSGNMRYFECKMPKFSVEIKVFTRQIMEFLLDRTWNFHIIWHFHKT